MKKILYIALTVSVIANIFSGITIYNKSKKQESLEKQIELERKQFERKRKDGETLDISELSSKGKEKLVEEAYSVENLSEEEKIRIGKKLFDEYMSNAALEIRKGDKEDRAVTLKCSNYRITDASVVETSGNKFMVHIGYDVQGLGNYKWYAAFGDIAEDNWVLNKFIDLEIIKCGDKYYISSASY